MSKPHKLPVTKSSITLTELRPRAARHGRPQVGPESPYHKPAVTRTVTHDRSVKTDAHGQFVTVPERTEIVVVSPARPMSQDEVQAERAKIKRATNSTITYGAKNVPPSKKGA